MTEVLCRCRVWLLSHANNTMPFEIMVVIRGHIAVSFMTFQMTLLHIGLPEVSSISFRAFII